MSVCCDYIFIVLSSWTPLIMNKSVHEQIFQKKKSRVTNGVSSNEHASRQQWLATSWEYQRESISCCLTFAQCTSLLEFAVPSLEFHCVCDFFIYYKIRHLGTKEGKIVSVYEHFGWQTASRDELNSWTEFPLCVCVYI
jgi:hypothetical protein